jgi:hypothetical protein
MARDTVAECRRADGGVFHCQLARARKARVYLAHGSSATTDGSQAVIHLDNLRPLFGDGIYFWWGGAGRVHMYRPPGLPYVGGLL